MNPLSGGRKGRLVSSCLILAALVGLTILARLSGQDPRDLSRYPWLYLRGGEPSKSEEEASSLLARIGGPPYRLAFACSEETCQRVDMNQRATERKGLFWGGEIDLTGDGIPERVRRKAGRVIVHHDGEEVWRSPPRWHVTDLVLGDPNGDGRDELLLAFWRRDAEGALRSHPFIVGYRGGIYRTLWGGSAVSDPIHEVELGDVDGDGTQELIVLEGYDSGPERTVAAWRWHGWGFILMWRSPPGRYRDLSIDDWTPDGSPIISVAVKTRHNRTDCPRK